VGARLLFIGDIHLGRRPARLPARLDEHGLSPADLGPAAAWRACVGWACEEHVDAVVMAGDVVDALDDRFEAYGHLKRGVELLVDAQIPTFAVVGNHDVEALPRLADEIAHFHLLGRGGSWDSLRLETRAGVPLRLLGWSFPAARVPRSPLALPLPASEPGVATLGVLHCDLAASGSDYAPVTRAELERAPADAWLLGHVHKPGDLGTQRPIGYLGSLVGLDPGEPGPHGPWLVEVEGAGQVRARQLPLAPLRWERIELPLSELDPASEVELPDRLARAVRDRIEALHREIAAEREPGAPGPRVVGCRLAIRGRGRHHRALRAHLDSLPLEPTDGVLYFVEKVEDEGAPDLDLAALAAGSDPPALVARRLLQLEAGTEAGTALLREARAQLSSRVGQTRWPDLAQEVVDDDALRELLRRAGTRQLEELLAQRAGGGA